MEQDPLTQLRDIHLPEAVGLWPLATGWWLLLVLFMLLLTLLLRHLWRRMRRRRYRKLAVGALAAHYQGFQQDGDKAAYISASQEILRRAALQRYRDKRALIAPLSGRAWISFLDSCIDKPIFSATFGDALDDAHYQRSTPIEPAELHRSARYWLRNHR